MRLPAFALALWLAASATAAELTVYRCTSDDGAVALRDTPCPAGTREQAFDMQRPRDPAPVASVPAPPPAAQAAPAASAARVVFVEAPRPLYRCTTHDGDTYTADDGAGNPRWVPAWTLGDPAYWPLQPQGHRVGAPRPAPPGDGPGPPDVPPGIGIAYTPGVWVRDRCVQLPAAQACDLLLGQKRALRKEWFNAMPSRRAQVAEEERLLATRIGRTCGQRSAAQLHGEER